MKEKFLIFMEYLKQCGLIILIATIFSMFLYFFIYLINYAIPINGKEKVSKADNEEMVIKDCKVIIDNFNSVEEYDANATVIILKK